VSVGETVGMQQRSSGCQDGALDDLISH
jgi:hypothetical protein